MTAVFLDTNFFVRFLVADNIPHHIECVRLAEKISSGKIQPYTSNVVIMELLYVLTKLYKQPKTISLQKISKILQMRNLTLIEVTDTGMALQLFKQHNMKYGDCLIATQVPKGVTLVTFDSDFRKIPSLSAATPDKITPVA